MTTVLRTVPVSLPDLPALADHAIQGKATVPAAWLLDLLVRTTTEANAVADPTTKLVAFPLVMRAAIFPRFLPADEVEQCTFEVALDDVVGEDAKASTRATLTSRIALSGGICRTRKHAAVTVGGSLPLPPSPPAEVACDLELLAQRAYAELIPFGPHYRNLRGQIRLGRDGGTGWVASPEPVGPEPSRAGCPYLFDSAMHLACLWGQRYAGVVAYPTGYSARAISSPLAHGQRRCVVVPRSIGSSVASSVGLSVESRGLTFDLWLADENHRVCDTIVGLTMAPVARGPLPPAWIVHPQAFLHTP